MWEKKNPHFSHSSSDSSLRLGVSCRLFSGSAHRQAPEAKCVALLPEHWASASPGERDAAPCGEAAPPSGQGTTGSVSTLDTKMIHSLAFSLHHYLPHSTHSERTMQMNALKVRLPHVQLRRNHVRETKTSVSLESVQNTKLPTAPRLGPASQPAPQVTVDG